MSLTYFLTFVIGVNIISIAFYIAAIVLRKKKTTPWILGALGLLAGIFLVVRRLSGMDSAFLAAWSLLLFLIFSVLTLIILIVGRRRDGDDEDDEDDEDEEDDD